MRQILKICCCFLTVFFCLQGVSKGNDAAETTLNTQITSNSDKTVLVELFLDKVELLAGMKVVMSYEKNVLQYKSMEKSASTQSLMSIANDKVHGKLIVVMAGAKGISGTNLPLMKLNFVSNHPVLTLDKINFSINSAEFMSEKLKNIPYKLGETKITVGD